MVSASRSLQQAHIRTVHLAAEYYPFSRTGGLGEAVSGITRAQASLGTSCTVIAPLHRGSHEAGRKLTPLDVEIVAAAGSRTDRGRLWEAESAPGEPRILLIEHLEYFDRAGVYGENGADYPDNPRRFAFLTLAALNALPHLGDPPLVLHAHDWHTALAPLLVSQRRHDPYWRQVSTVLTVHNASFQGIMAFDVAEDAIGPLDQAAIAGLHWFGQANWLKAGLVMADATTTVSATHASELRTREGGFGLHSVFAALQDRLLGIRNGIDTVTWSPATDPCIAANYSPQRLAGKRRCKAALQRAFMLEADPARPLVAGVARLVQQKGIDLVLQVIHRMRDDAEFVIVGRGDPGYERELRAVAARYPGRVSVPLDFNDTMERIALAGADMLLMPSLFEPCGLTQMRAQRYGTLPVARRVGGLAETVRDGETGFLFDAYTPDALEETLRRACQAYRDPRRWRGMMVQAMTESFDWREPAREYTRLYRALQPSAPERREPRGSSRLVSAQADP